MRHIEFPEPHAVPAPPVGYHNGSTKDPRNNGDGKRKAIPMSEREIIAWDMEGMNLSGDDKPQHPVLFGCSVESDTPLIGQNLTTAEMLNYIISIGEQHPQAIHVGYHFNFDVNMILRNLPYASVYSLWKNNRARFKIGEHCWTVQYFPGKKFIVTRSGVFRFSPGRKDRTTVTINDYSSFFGGKAFLAACEDILRDDLSEDDREVIAHGKAERGSNTWDRLDEVRHYWEREILLIARVFGRFRDVMCQAGFALKEWYGPGALANYINSAHGLKPHIAAAQKPTGFLPEEVHEASKVAFSGGHFEAYQLGYVPGPVYAVDINSAYPDALRMIPSLSPDNGTWRHVRNPNAIERFGFYRINFKAPNHVPVEFRPMPLFWRDPNGLVSYPNKLVGVYASPEARIVAGMPGVEIEEGWYFDFLEEIYPWRFLEDMYATRQRIGKENLLSIPFKLGPNSLYGKYAQTVGWNEEKNEPPTWHALPIAAWVTSMCRAKLWAIVRQASRDVIAVETDSVFLTKDPRTMRIPLGDELGQWSLKTYDNIVYIQSGMYLTQKDGEWNGVRSRGISRTEFDPENVLDYLRGLRPGRPWQPFSITTKPRFVGMGTALASHEFHSTWRTWRTQQKDITFGDTGKRRHHQRFCRACQQGMTPLDGPHRAFIASTSDGFTMSHPRSLPWEQVYSDAVQNIRQARTLDLEATA